MQQNETRLLPHAPTAMCDPIWFTPLTLILLLVLAGCASSRTYETDPDAVAATQSIDSFVNYMEDKGLTMRLDGLPAQPYFSIDAQQFTIGGDESLSGRLEVYTFASQSEARQSLGRIKVERGAIPNVDFYIQDRLVVVYFGNDPDVDAALAAVLRPM